MRRWLAGVSPILLETPVLSNSLNSRTSPLNGDVQTVNCCRDDDDDDDSNDNIRCSKLLHRAGRHLILDRNRLERCSKKSLIPSVIVRAAPYTACRIVASRRVASRRSLRLTNCVRRLLGCARTGAASLSGARSGTNVVVVVVVVIVVFVAVVFVDTAEHQSSEQSDASRSVIMSDVAPDRATD